MHFVAIAAALAAALPSAHVPVPRCQIIEDVAFDADLDSTGHYVPTTTVISITRKCRDDGVRRVGLRSRP